MENEAELSSLVLRPLTLILSFAFVFLPGLYRP